jgi:regulator of protease activity HflC (stomatin/prohibitin superfamily)
MTSGLLSLIVLLLLALFVIIVLVRTVKIVPQQTALIIERLGRYSRTLEPGLHLLVPFVDVVRANIDLREQVVSFPPQPVITSDNLVVSIDTVIYYQVIDPKSAVYEIANFIQGIEQLTVTTLRNVIGSLDLEQTLTSRDQINGQLRGVLDEATGKWGIRVNRVELKAIDPPQSIQESMEKQMKAERDRRAIILNAEGTKASQILTAEGEKQSQILRAEGSAQARILEAQGQARAIQQVFDAIHRGKPTQKLLAYQYLQVLPQIARGDSNKMWIIPSELTDALKGIGGMLGRGQQGFDDGGDDDAWVDPGEIADAFEDATLEDPAEALARARGQAGMASREAEEHGAPASRVQPPIAPGADAVPPRPANVPPAPVVPPAPPVPFSEEQPPPPPPPATPVAGPDEEPPAPPR